MPKTTLLHLEVESETLDLLKSHDLHAQAILILPIVIFWTLLSTLCYLCPESFVDCKPWGLSGQLQSVSTTCAFKEKMEQPNRIIYAILMTAIFITVLKDNRTPEKLKRFALILLCILGLAIRCLSSFSGQMIIPAFQFLLFNPNSPGKCLWLWLLVEMPLWNYTYLGVYEDVRYDAATRCIYDQHGYEVHKFVTEDVRHSFEPSYFPWQDVIVRLACIHLLDNLILIAWLRFGFTNAPYTAYINNSEILTGCLMVALALYTYARMQSRVVLADSENHDEGTLIAEKTLEIEPFCGDNLSSSHSLDPPRQPYQSGYFFQQSQPMSQLTFRKRRTVNYWVIIVVCLFASVIIATWDSLFWQMILLAP